MAAALYYVVTRGDIPCLKTVFFPYLQGIEAELFCYHIEHRFYNKSTLNRSMPPLCPTIRFIGIDTVSLIFEVRDHIGPILATTMKVDGDRPKAVIGATICDEYRVHSHNFAIFFHPYLLIHNSRMAP